MLSSSTHVFSDMYFHANWHCHRDEPMITESLEAALFPFLLEYCNGLDGVLPIEVGGTETHVHILFKAEPHVQLSEFVGKVKGASSHAMNKEFGTGALKWQRGYGLVTFAGRNLPALRSYVMNQEEHHARSTTNRALESSGVEEREDG